MALLRLSIAATLAVCVSGHGSIITPAPRSAHGQKFDAANKCDCHQTGHCYSNITGDAEYCGVGCLGEACLYYQIGCFAGCGTCSYSGKDLYPSAEDLQLAGNCVPVEPTLPTEMRSYNRDTLSTQGDWTKVNPWRAPGTAGRGNSMFQPCGVNSGWLTDKPVRGSAGPPAGGQRIGANGTDLPPVGPPTAWKRGGIADVEFSIYANHGGGYAYRLCKADSAGVPTEECFQGGHLKFATETTTIKYYDNSRAPFNITAKTTDVGTFPAGSQWRLNPIPMCNCDQGAYCEGNQDAADAVATAAFHHTMRKHVAGKVCKAVSKSQCGTEVGVDTCLECKEGGNYDCEECCPGCQQVSKSGYTWCQCGKGPAPPPPPSPPVDKCEKVMADFCSAQKQQGAAQCDACLKSHLAQLKSAACTLKDFGWCKSGPSPPPSPPPSPGGRYNPYPKTYLPDGVKSQSCPTGLMFNASWPEGVGSGPSSNGYGRMPYSMTDKVEVPTELGRYTLSWRWDCEQTPQVWNSCADIIVV